MALGKLIGFIQDEELGNIEVHREDDGRITFWKPKWWAPYFDAFLILVCLTVFVILYKFYYGVL